MRCDISDDLSELEKTFNELMNLKFDKIPRWKYEEIKKQLKQLYNQILTAKFIEVSSNDGYLQELSNKIKEIDEKINELQSEKTRLNQVKYKYECDIRNAIRNELDSKINAKLLEFLTL